MLSVQQTLAEDSVSRGSPMPTVCLLLFRSEARTPSLPSAELLESSPSEAGDWGGRSFFKVRKHHLWRDGIGSSGVGEVYLTSSAFVLFLRFYSYSSYYFISLLSFCFPSNIKRGLQKANVAHSNKQHEL